MRVHPYEFAGAAADVMSGWDTRLQMTYIAPAPEADDKNDLLPATTEREKAPRPNIVISRLQATERTAYESCVQFLDQTASAVPDFNVSTDPSGSFIQDFEFHDGITGAFAEVTFPAAPGVVLKQTHAFRIDDGTLTQLVGTYAATQVDPWRDRLHAIIAGFKPLGWTAPR